IEMEKGNFPCVNGKGIRFTVTAPRPHWNWRQAASSDEVVSRRGTRQRSEGGGGGSRRTGNTQRGGTTGVVGRSTQEGRGSTCGEHDVRQAGGMVVQSTQAL